jgi:menaquinone-dependent protoporphyrinogen IX oxidase
MLLQIERGGHGGREMTKKALIVYGTRFGATTGTSEEIANVLRNEGFDARIVNAKKEKVDDISGYDLVIVGSGIMINRWTGEPEKFLNKFQKELAGKKVALFVSSGGLALLEFEGKAEEIESTRRKYLEEKAAKYNLQPIALGLFGGIWDLDHLPWWSGKAMAAIKQKLEEAGLEETRPGVYDTRDWNAIRNWAKGLVAKPE